jgi:LmbE family N-acetylglucosaminyl deacetylase
MELSDFYFYNLKTKEQVKFFQLFRNWEDKENVVIFSPHDDDSILGAGYALLACKSMGASVHVVILCDGSAGYSDASQSTQIVALRKQETIDALKTLKIPQENIHRFNIPDFSAINYVGWKAPGRDQSLGITEQLIKLLRRLKCTRLLLPNGFREHSDHTAASISALFDGIQAGDSVLVDWGDLTTIRSFLMYSVWGAFSPLDEEISDLFTIGVIPEIEMTIRNALSKWESQQAIIKGIMQRRDSRLMQEKNQYIELYLSIDPRPQLDINKYKRILSQIQ